MTQEGEGGVSGEGEGPAPGLLQSKYFTTVLLPLLPLLLLFDSCQQLKLLLLPLRFA
jgi:hypothetical protein